MSSHNSNKKDNHGHDNKDNHGHGHEEEKEYKGPEKDEVNNWIYTCGFLFCCVVFCFWLFDSHKKTLPNTGNSTVTVTERHYYFHFFSNNNSVAASTSNTTTAPNPSPSPVTISSTAITTDVPNGTMRTYTLNGQTSFLNVNPKGMSSTGSVYFIVDGETYTFEHNRFIGKTPSSFASVDIKPGTANTISFIAK